MTLNERFVGGNPRVLLPLFCLFCVVLICFVGICLNMMRKSEKNLKSLTKIQTHHIQKKKIPSKKKNLHFPEGWHDLCLWWHGRANPSAKKKKKFQKRKFFVFLVLPHSKEHNLFHFSNLHQHSNLHIYLHSSFQT